MKGNHDKPPFQVAWSARVRGILKSMSLRASPTVRQQLAGFLRSFDARLAEDPFAVGEVYRSRNNIAEHLAAYEFLVIDFGIDRLRGLVLVRDCWALSGHGID